MSDKAKNKLNKLDFLIGKWHTEGLTFEGPGEAEMRVRGMDSYEWICNNSFILHRVDVMMGDTRTEVIEIIEYDPSTKEYIMESFDSVSEKTTMHASLSKSGNLKLKAPTMRATLSVNKKQNAMTATWERKEKNGDWINWMEVKLIK